MERAGTNENTKRPLIGILANLLVVESNPFPGLERSYVNHDYVAAVEAAGGIPVMLPVVGNPQTIRCQIEAVDAVLATGGYDPDPMLWGEQPNRRIEFIHPEVDQHQLQAIRVAYELGKPVLGICRGLQMINIAFGGSLYQDLSLVPDSFIQHFQKSLKYAYGHQVSLVKGTRLSAVFGDAGLAANSFHHLAIRVVAPGFLVNAYAPDGVIEGIESTGGASVMAVQWHPEMMYLKHPEMLGIFVHFIAVTKEAQAR